MQIVRPAAFFSEYSEAGRPVDRHSKRLTQKENALMNLKMVVISNFRHVARSVLQMFEPIFLEYFPAHLRWERNEPTDWPLANNREKEGLERYEYSLFSQNGEDGILRFLFSEIGFSSKTLVEFGFGVTENNSLRLILIENFSGVLIDGLSASVKAFNKGMKNIGIANVKAVSKFLDLANLKTTLLGNELPFEIDLLSIDVDGNDYWFWKDINYLNPRIVVIEYNASLGPEFSLSVPYDPLFDRHQKHLSGFYHGASLTALTKLAREKGYILAGCDSNGVNAFFVRLDCATQRIREMSPLNAYRPHATRLKKGSSVQDQFEIIKGLPFVVIE